MKKYHLQIYFFYISGILNGQQVILKNIVLSTGLESSTTLGKKSYWSALIDQKVNNKGLVGKAFNIHHSIMT